MMCNSGIIIFVLRPPVHRAGESNDDVLRLDFDRRLLIRFPSDAGLLPYGKLDDMLGLSVTASDILADIRTGNNGRQALAGLFRQSVFGRLACYEDGNDAERLRDNPANAPDCGRQGSSQLRGIAEPDGPLRDKVAFCEKESPSCSPSAERHPARHGVERQSDSRRTREQRLEWPLS